MKNEKWTVTIQDGEKHIIDKKPYSMLENNGTESLGRYI